MGTNDPTYNVKNQEQQGGVLLSIAGQLDIDKVAGGKLTVDGVDVTPSLATVAAGLAAGYKIARGVHVQVAAADTIATGLATVVACTASFRDAPTIKQLFVEASEGDQAGAPVAGSIVVSTFKPTAVNDVTPVAATDFTQNIKISWTAVGT